GWAAPQLLGALVVLDDLGDSAADAFVAEVDRAARASGSVLGIFVALATSGWLHSRRGDLAAAEADLTTALTLAREAGLSMGVANVAFWMIDVLLERDGLADIGELIEQIDLAPVFLKTWAGAMLLEARGRLRIAHNQRAPGIEDLRAVGRTATALGFGPAVSAWRSSLAVALPTEAREEALALAREELSLASVTGLARPEGIALRALGILAGPPHGIESLEGSVALLTDSPARLEHARSLVALGSELRRANRPTRARGPLTAGLDLAYACGATRLSERAQQELLAAGGRRRRRSTSDRDSLTASELRIAELAAGGAANAEIAQTLYISLKTVETHLSRVYAKLGLAGSGSRARLVDALKVVRASP
ncbi:MAG: LuxR C-terminal-related transcriptional regulator, partial [Actinomycetota bacterium]|nr:LuxR C-terminal-related transcriptional regulator [Actinomycetota bacterium]